MKISPLCVARSNTVLKVMTVRLVKESQKSVEDFF